MDKHKCPKCGKELTEEAVMHGICPQCHQVFDIPETRQVLTQENREEEQPTEGKEEKAKIEEREEQEEMPTKTINKFEIITLSFFLILLLVSWFTIPKIITDKKASQKEVQFQMLQKQQEEKEKERQEQSLQSQSSKETEKDAQLQVMQKQSEEATKKAEEATKLAKEKDAQLQVMQKQLGEATKTEVAKKIETNLFSLKKPAYPSSSVLDNLITCNVTDLDLVAALKQICNLTGANIVLSAGIFGKVTMNVKDLPLRQFLDIIADTNGFKYTEKDNVIKIMAPEKEVKTEIAKKIKIDSLSKSGTKVFIPGMGFDIIRPGDNIEKILRIFGNPETTRDYGRSYQILYQRKYGMDFLMDTERKIIKEIRFDEGFAGYLENGIKIGDSLSEVLRKYGGALKTVKASKDETHGVMLGSDRVLYQQFISGEITAYKFINAKAGVLFWFNQDGKLIQAVVF